MIRDPLAIAALIAGATALAFWLDHRFDTLSKVGASLLVIIFGALLANTGIVPARSPVYRGIEGPVTSLAIVYLLLEVRLADLRRAGPMMLVLFVVAAAGTALGSLVGAAMFADSLGVETWKLAGAFTGTYTGGSLNFTAVGRGLGLESSTFAAAAAADAVTTAIWMAITLAVPILLVQNGVAAASGAAESDIPPAGIGPPRGSELAEPDAPAATAAGDPDAGAEAEEHPHPFWTPVPVSLFDLVLLAGIGMAVLIAARLLAERVGLVPEILWLTTVALALGQIPRVRRVRGAGQLGNLGLHLFFVVIGIRSLLSAMLEVGPAVFFYTLVVVGTHGIFLYLVGRLLRGSVPMIAVVSQAAVGGPSTALAVAVSRGWPALILPGVAVGLLGYALGNYTGFGIAYLVRAMIGG